MKKTKRLFTLASLFLISTCFIFFSCIKKTAPVVLPQVGISSVAYEGLDTVTAKGTIISTGNSDITAEGFIYSTNPDFSGSVIQVSAYGSPAFSALIHAMHYTTYYFKSFAANSKGTAYSNVVKYTVPAPAPATAPCTLSNNVVNDNGTTFSVTAVGDGTNPSWGSYEVNLYGSAEDVYLYFPDLPHNGIYNTVADPSNISAGQVSISMSGISGISVDDGQKVYVALDTVNRKTIITFCSLSYNLGGLGTGHISGKGTY